MQLKGRKRKIIYEEECDIDALFPNNVKNIPFKNREWQNDLGQSENVIEWIKNPQNITLIRQGIEVVSNLCNENTKLLDIGCYGGYLFDALGRNIDYTGIDIDEEVLKQTKKIHANYNNFRCLLVDAYNLPFKNNSFDITTCFRVLIHVPHIEEIISEIVRVTKKYIVMVLKIGKDKTIKRTYLEEGKQKIEYYRTFKMETLNKIFNRLSVKIIDTCRAKDTIYTTITLEKELNLQEK